MAEYIDTEPSASAVTISGFSIIWKTFVLPPHYLMDELNLLKSKVVESDISFIVGLGFGMPDVKCRRYFKVLDINKHII